MTEEEQLRVKFDFAIEKDDEGLFDRFLSRSGSIVEFSRLLKVTQLL
jgi:hypothetical protein